MVVTNIETVRSSPASVPCRSEAGSHAAADSAWTGGIRRIGAGIRILSDPDELAKARDRAAEFERRSLTHQAESEERHRAALAHSAHIKQDKR
jgi:hypothetical protein